MGYFHSTTQVNWVFESYNKLTQQNLFRHEYNFTKECHHSKFLLFSQHIAKQNSISSLSLSFSIKLKPCKKHFLGTDPTGLYSN